jgi:phosphoribosylpyrophosphate synthetase
MDSTPRITTEQQMLLRNDKANVLIDDCCDSPAIMMKARKCGKYKGAATEIVILCDNHAVPRELFTLKYR